MSEHATDDEEDELVLQTIGIDMGRFPRRASLKHIMVNLHNKIDSKADTLHDTIA